MQGWEFPLLMFFDQYLKKNWSSRYYCEKIIVGWSRLIDNTNQVMASSEKSLIRSDFYTIQHSVSNCFYLYYISLKSITDIYYIPAVICFSIYAFICSYISSLHYVALYIAYITIQNIIITKFADLYT